MKELLKWGGKWFKRGPWTADGCDGCVAPEALTMTRGRCEREGCGLPCECSFRCGREADEGSIEWEGEWYKRVWGESCEECVFEEEGTCPTAQDSAGHALLLCYSTLQEVDPLYVALRQVEEAT